MKITIYQCYDPNSYDPDFEDFPYEIEGYRYVIDLGTHKIISTTMFTSKTSCSASIRRAIKRFYIKLPDNFTITTEEYANAEFIIWKRSNN